MRRWGQVVAVVGVVWAAPAWAQLDGDQAKALADAESKASPVDTAALTGELGFGGLGEDYFLTLSVGFNFDREDYGFGVQVPLRLRVWDRDPQNDADFGGVLRREDWDQASDYLRIIRYVYFGQADKRGPYYVRLGELSALSVGHGTIMHRYFNGIDANKWRTGIDAVVNVGPYHGEVVLGDLFDPYLVGLRFSLRPFDAVTPNEADRNPWLSRLVVGHSLFLDGKAPIALARDAEGDVVRSDQGPPEVSRERALLVLGLVDVAYEVLDTELLRITPYMDINKITQVRHGWGWHLGILWNLRLPLGFDDLVVDARTEYRFVSSDYVGPYFNPVYEIERYQHLAAAGGTSQPKLLYLCGGDPQCDVAVGGPRHGWYFEARAGLPKWVFLGLEYLDYAGPRADGQFRVSLEVPALEFVQLSAYYYRVNVEGPGDLFAIDDKSAIVAQAKVPLYWVFTLNLRWWRVWRSCGNAGTACEDGGEGYQSVDDWSVGVGASFTF